MEQVQGNINNKEFLKCPRCTSRALYRYGKCNSSQRFLCLICGRQFVEGHVRKVPQRRPQCPLCGRAMHLYMDTETHTRYRCGAYPQCRHYVKITK
ncbi:IS1/IS1595 family N-terminal zinc-binding domain-containing protein [Syntrophus gentianae]|uniref:IS1/IS1595 family N-terminal zinc-binding domain-containing protein n=1 Tax=Syntrophus gentianae TaxID=43775 RepID=UPI003B27D7B8